MGWGGRENDAVVLTASAAAGNHFLGQLHRPLHISSSLLPAAMKKRVQYKSVRLVWVGCNGREPRAGSGCAACLMHCT